MSTQAPRLPDDPADAAQAGIMTRLASALVWVAAGAAVLVALLGTADALSTVLRGRPLPGVVEVTELSLVIIVSMTQPWIVLKGAHITLDLFALRRGGAVYYLRLALTLASVVLVYGIIARTGWDSFVQSWRVGQETDGLVRLPVYPVKLLLVIGMVAAALMMPVLVWHEIRRQRSKGGV